MNPLFKNYIQLDSVNPANGQVIGRLDTSSRSFDFGNIIPGYMCPVPVVIKITKVPGGSINSSELYLALQSAGFSNVDPNLSATYYALSGTWNGGDWVAVDHMQSIHQQNGWVKLVEMNVTDATVKDPSGNPSTGVIKLNLAEGYPAYVWIAMFVGPQVTGTTQGINLRIL